MTGEKARMVAYEFYLKNGDRGDQLLGILPERRIRSDRISQESIMNWARMAFSNNLDVSKVFFVQINLENTLGIKPL
jgi:hypothetical protein